MIALGETPTSDYSHNRLHILASGYLHSHLSPELRRGRRFDSGRRSRKEDRYLLYCGHSQHISRSSTPGRSNHRWPGSTAGRFFSNKLWLIRFPKVPDQNLEDPPFWVCRYREKVPSRALFLLVTEERLKLWTSWVGDRILACDWTVKLGFGTARSLWSLLNRPILNLTGFADNPHMSVAWIAGSNPNSC